VLGAVGIAGCAVFAVSTLDLVKARGTDSVGMLTSIDSPWKELILFGSMVAGMMSKYLWDLIEVRRSLRLKRGLEVKVPIGFDIWECIQPLLVAGIVFTTVLSTAKTLTFPLILLSYQNGFFWQTILRKGAKGGALN
jgi:hypothetical protein